MFSGWLRRIPVVAGGALAVFHGWLFVSQAAAGRLDDPWVVFRWIAAAALVVAMVAVRRRVGSLLGRKSIAIWLLAALLHGPAIADTDGIRSFAIPETAATSILQLVSSAGFAIGLWILAALLTRRRSTSLRLVSLIPASAIADRFAAGHALCFSPRPPPLRA